MSFYEYDDLYELCQNDAPYHMFIYDMIDSKSNFDINRQEKLKLLINSLYTKLKELEIKQGITILHTNDLFNKENNGYLQEPFLIDGDTIGFTIIRDSMIKKEVNELFFKTKEFLNINYDFHLADGYYETDLYEEGNNKYFRGYCIKKLNTKHKKKNAI